MPRRALASSPAKPASSRALNRPRGLRPSRREHCRVRRGRRRSRGRSRPDPRPRAGPSPLAFSWGAHRAQFLATALGRGHPDQRYVEALADTATRITDTRKTTPGWRHLQKWAVRLGGGVNHRMGLYDAVLIKENHAAAAGGVRAAIREARGQAAPIYVEAENLGRLRRLLRAARTAFCSTTWMHRPCTGP